MKKIYNMLFALVALVAFAACSNDVDDVFDKSSAQRVNDTMEECRNVLTSAENGWLMRYFPKANTPYGGYNMLLKFGVDGDVTAMSEVYGPETTATSHYKFEQSAGVVLSFDEYNKVIHFFSEPSNAAGVGDPGKGMEGDLEFRILSVSPDSVVMMGKKHGAKIVMTPLAKDTSWKAALNNLAEVEEKTYFPEYSFEANGVTYKATVVNHTITFHQKGDEENFVTEPFVVTDKGILFYHPIQLNGTTISGFNYVEGKDDELSTPEGTVKVTGVLLPITKYLTREFWFFSVANMGSYAQRYWNQGNASVSKYYEPCYYGVLGTTNFEGYLNHWGILFNVGGYGSFIDLTLGYVDDEHISLACPGVFGINGEYFYEWGQKSMIYTLTGDNGKHAAGVSKTFKVELVAGTAKRPTAIKLTDIKNSNNWYILTTSMPESVF